MNPVPLSDLFEEYALEGEPISAAERTRLTIRVEGLPSRWRAWRAWAGLLLVVAAAAVAGKLVDSRRSSTRQYPRAPEPKAARPAPAPHAGRQPRLPKAPRSAAAPARRKHARHRPRRKLRGRAAAKPRPSAERATSRQATDVVPDHAQPSFAAPPTTGDTPPTPARQVGRSRPYSRASVGEKGNEQFDYLGR
jgi:hypothetical protein